MNYQSIIQSIAEGTATALVWAALLWLANFALNWRTERKLRKTLSYIGSAFDPEGFGVTIKNDTDVEVIVRDVTLLTSTPNKGLGLLFIDMSTGYTFQEKPFKDPRQIEIMRTVPPSDPVIPSKDPVVLPPYTGGRWMAPNSLFLEHPELEPSKCHIALLYKNLFGRPKIMVVESNEKNAEFLQDQFKKHIENLKKEF